MDRSSAMSSVARQCLNIIKQNNNASFQLAIQKYNFSVARIIRDTLKHIVIVSIRAGAYLFTLSVICLLVFLGKVEDGGDGVDVVVL